MPKRRRLEEEEESEGEQENRLARTLKRNHWIVVTKGNGFETLAEISYRKMLCIKLVFEEDEKLAENPVEVSEEDGLLYLYSEEFEETFPFRFPPGSERRQRPNIPRTSLAYGWNLPPRTPYIAAKEEYEVEITPGKFINGKKVVLVDFDENGSSEMVVRFADGSVLGKETMVKVKNGGKMRYADLLEADEVVFKMGDKVGGMYGKDQGEIIYK